MLRVVNAGFSYAVCNYAEFRYAESQYAEFCYANTRYAECRILLSIVVL
jgi:hypothetical protein